MPNETNNNMTLAQQATDYIHSYYNSEGFKARRKQYNWKLGEPRVKIRRRMDRTTIPINYNLQGHVPSLSLQIEFQTVTASFKHISQNPGSELFKVVCILWSYEDFTLQLLSFKNTETRKRVQGTAICPCKQLSASHLPLYWVMILMLVISD